jgi:hypothetical protein
MRKRRLGRHDLHVLPKLRQFSERKLQLTDFYKLAAADVISWKQVLLAAKESKLHSGLRVGTLDAKPARSIDRRQCEQRL